MGSASLPQALLFDVLKLLPPQELACNGRRLFKAAAAYFSELADRTVWLSVPMAPCVARSWRAGAEPGLAQLPLASKLAFLSTAAASGCQANLEAAWALLQPALVPEWLPPASRHYTDMYRKKGGLLADVPDPGAAAATAGHLHLLPWMLEQRLPLAPVSTMLTVAYRGDLAALQDTVALMRSHWADRELFGTYTVLQLMESAAQGGGPHAPDKLTWLRALYFAVNPGGEDPDWGLRTLAPEPLFATDTLPALRWIWGRWARDRRAQQDLPTLLLTAIRFSKREVVEWLVNDAGCPLPGAPRGGVPRGPPAVEDEATEEERPVANLVWLQQQGADVRRMPRQDAEDLLAGAVGGGQLRLARYLHEECGVGLGRASPYNAVRSGSVEMATWLRAAGRAPEPGAYTEACSSGDLPMLRWLLHDAATPLGDVTLLRVMELWPGKGLLGAVQLLAEAGCPMGGGTAALKAAAGRGDLPLVRFLHEEHGVALGPWVLASAAEGGCEALLAWLVGAGCREGFEAEEDPYVAATWKGDLASLGSLRRLGVPLGGEVLVRTGGCPLSVLELLAEWGAAANREVVERALAQARLWRSREAVAVWLQGLLEDVGGAASGKEVKRGKKP